MGLFDSGAQEGVFWMEELVENRRECETLSFMDLSEFTLVELNAKKESAMKVLELKIPTLTDGGDQAKRTVQSVEEEIAKRAQNQVEHSTLLILLRDALAAGEYMHD